MRNKYSLTAQLLGKRTYSNAVDRMYESLVEPRNNKPPEWLAKRQKMLDDIESQYYNMSGAFLSDEDREEVKKANPLDRDINKDYEEAKEIHTFLKAVQPGVVSNPDNVKTKIERYVKLSKDIRRKLKKLADIAAGGAPGKGFKSYFDQGNLGIEPMQDFLDTKRYNTGRQRQVVGGQDGEVDNIYKEPSKRFEQEINVDGKEQSLQDYLVDAIKDAGVTAGEKAGRYGRKAKQRPPTLTGPRGGLSQDNVSDFSDPKLGNKINPKGFEFKVNTKKAGTNPIDYTATIMGSSYGDISNDVLAANAESLTRIDFHLDQKATTTAAITMTDFSEAMAALAVNGKKAKGKNLSPGDKTGSSTIVDGGGDNFVQGPSKSYDVHSAVNQKKWEVKQLKTFSAADKAVIGDDTPDIEAAGGNARLGVAAQEMTAVNKTKFQAFLGNKSLPGNPAAGLINLKGNITSAGNDFVKILLNGKGGNTQDRGDEQSYRDSPRNYVAGLWYAGTGAAKTFLSATEDKELSGALGLLSRVPYLLSDIVFETGKYMDSLTSKDKDAVRTYVNKNETLFPQSSGYVTKFINRKGEEVIIPGKKRSRANKAYADQFSDSSIDIGGMQTEEEFNRPVNVIATCQATPVLFGLVFKRFMAGKPMPTRDEAEFAIKNLITELFPGNIYSMTTTATDGTETTRTISSFDQNIELVNKYLEDGLAGFIFTYVDSTRERFSVYVIPGKACSYWASTGAIKFIGPSSGKYKIEFTPPESPNKKYLTNPLARYDAIKAAQDLAQKNETYSVFNGGSPGRTLNEWVKWATK